MWLKDERFLLDKKFVLEGAVEYIYLLLYVKNRDEVHFFFQFQPLWWLLPDRSRWVEVKDWYVAVDFVSFRFIHSPLL
jgi:hypothetical protein